MIFDSFDIVEIKHGGVTCKSDFGLYNEHYSQNYVYLLSLYGSPQQVKAIFSLLSTLWYLEVKIKDQNIHIQREYKASLKFKGYSIGYGKQHGIIWAEDINERIIFWTSPEEKTKAFRNALSRRKVPFDPNWVPAIEILMLKNGYLEKLNGWGGVGGYFCKWDDDAICDLIAESLKKEGELSYIPEPVAVMV